MRDAPARMAALARDGWRAVEAVGVMSRFGTILQRGDPGEARFGMLVEPHHRGDDGSLAQGALLIFLDYAVGRAAVPAHGLGIVTLQLQTNFIAPVPVGAFLTSESRLMAAEGALLYLRASVMVGDRLVATADGVWKVLALPRE
ncbi:PaaI family thioesterase [Pararhodobacter marinus]|uniref:PaaI family thioesterase n=1 Tax=Pararhodobacter marinus TaxID=2184063 RepID=UPI0035185201